EKAGGGNRDYVLRWRLSGDRIATGVLASPPDEHGEGFFALMLEPPRRSADEDMPPREFVFLVDTSGSMNGFPLDTAKTLVRGLFAGLRPVDAFNVVMFSGGSRILEPAGSVSATPQNLAAAGAPAARFKTYIERPLLTDIKLGFDGLGAFEVAPARVPDLLAERPLVVFGKYRGKAAGRIEVTGRDGRGAFRRVVELQPTMVKAELAPLRWLWARKQA